MPVVRRSFHGHGRIDSFAFAMFRRAVSHFKPKDSAIVATEVELNSGG